MKSLDPFVVSDIKRNFHGKLWCFVPIMNKYGCGVGIATVNEAGYSPVNQLNGIPTYKEAYDLAMKLNLDICHFTEETAMVIIATTMKKEPEKVARTLALTLSQQEALEICISQLVETEADNFVEELPGYLGNDVDCSSDLERQALKDPEEYDRDRQHTYTCAVIIQKLIA